jgi:hypothetical protein
MADLASSYVMVHPNYVEPGVILPYFQASGAFDTLAGGEPLVRLGDGDLYAYIKRLDIRTKVAAGQAAYNAIPSISTTMSWISTPSYLLRVRGEYDHHDTAAMGNYGLSIVETQRLGMRQGHFQLLRQMLLYGMNPAGGEGLVYTAGATNVTLPDDTFGQDTITTYDNGQLGIFILTQISALKTRTNQLGIGREFVILGPQQDLGSMEYQDIVQLVSFQRDGAGSTSTAGMVKDMLEMNEDTILWVYDDTLIGKGQGGTDAILIVMPEVEKPQGSKINTNEIAKLAPGLDACTLMYMDMSAPREIPTPIPGGAIDVLSELRATSGWGIRPEAVTIISAQYE